MAPVAVASAAPRTVAPAAVRTVPATAAPSLSQQVVGAVMVQVASFSSRDNANRAMGQLNAAGIVGATISDIAAGGRTLFRLRVPASDHASAAELVGRIAGLGLGSPQIVRIDPPGLVLPAQARPAYNGRFVPPSIPGRPLEPAVQ